MVVPQVEAIAEANGISFDEAKVWTCSLQLLVVLQLLPLPFLPGATFERQAAFKRFCVTGRGMVLNTVPFPFKINAAPHPLPPSPLITSDWLTSCVHFFWWHSSSHWWHIHHRWGVDSTIALNLELFLLILSSYGKCYIICIHNFTIHFSDI